MKKKSLIFAFLAAAVSITSLTSCNDDATKTTEIKNYNLKDNEASLMAYNAFSESYPNLTYNDFRVDGRVNTSSNITVFTYGSSTLSLKDGAYYCKTIIIDGGGSDDNYDVGKSILLPYLLTKKINRIDYMFISHMDSDHCKGLFTVIENLKVRNVIISEKCRNMQFYSICKDIYNKTNIAIYHFILLLYL